MCAEMPAESVDDLLVLFELVVIITMSKLQKIDRLSLAVRFVDIGGTIHEEVLGFLSLERIQARLSLGLFWRYYQNET